MDNNKGIIASVTN